jgi:hypothetical protein
MSKGKGGGKSQAQLDQRSRSMNPQDAVGKATISNQTAQGTPGTPAHQAGLDNRSVQLNTPSPAPATAKPTTKPTTTTESTTQTSNS